MKEKMYELKRYIIYATIEEEGIEEEIPLAGEEDLVLECPRCGFIITVGEGEAVGFKDMDSFVEYLKESMSHIFKIKRVRVEEW
ncbi:MAG: hypothetical protein QXT28_09290 [Thermofilaceae archaeon]